MTTTPDIQVPGQLELPLEFDEPILKTVTYTETYTETVQHSVALEVPSNYKPLMDQILANPTQYQRTLRSMVLDPQRYENVSVSYPSSTFVGDNKEYSNFHIR